MSLLLRSTLVIFLLGLILSTSGCGILIGNTRSVDEKSESYGIAELSKENPDWVKLDPKKAGNAETDSDPGTTPTEVSDVAYQSKLTSSVISLSSACRPGKGPQAGKSSQEDLRSMTDILILGTANITRRDELDVIVQSLPGLQTTIQGEVGPEKVMIRTVVFRRKMCIYDLVYVARPKTFAINEAEFTHFVASLRLK